MRYFEVTYIAKGKKHSSYFKATSPKEAQQKASNLDGKIIKIIAKNPPMDVWIEESIQNLNSSSINQDIFIATIRQLGIMTQAGISIQSALQEVTDSIKDKKINALFLQVLDALNQGESLQGAMSHHKEQFGEVTILMVSIGENTGNIASSLLGLADTLEDIQKNVKKFKKAMRYPMAVLSAIVIAFVSLMLFVVPRFESIFTSLGANLPLPTKILLFCEYSLSHYGFIILAFIVGTFLLIRYQYKSNSTFALLLDRYSLKIYILGDIIFYSSMSRFFLVLFELSKAGINITDALKSATDTMTNSFIKQKLTDALKKISSGVSLTEALRDSGLIEGMLLQMLQAGEVSGSLEQMLQKIKEYYTSKSNELIDNISSYLEPILIGFIALLVLLMALGIFMPMWDMSSAMRH
jgi:general secretion pathway protein F/MSHA biogenesis protein MshG